MHFTRRLAAAGATALLASVTLTGCMEPITAEVGACLDSSALQGEVSSLPTISCEEEHDAEVYHSFVFSDEEFPGEAVVDEKAQDACLGAFEPYIGAEYLESDLQITYLSPMEEGWKVDREVLCIAQSTEAITGSMKGSGR